MPKKTITILLIIFVFTAGIFVPTKKANAILGVADVVIDPAHIATNVSGWIQEWGRYALDKALQVILATLKKRLLDRLVNQTVQWIQGNGSPRFVTDPEGFVRDAADAAIGDTIQEVGLGDLCSSSLRTQIMVQLEQTTFRDRVSCTLNDVIENISTFDDDFRNGTWIAYNEVLKPQNNRLGLSLLVQNEALERTARRQEQAQQEVQSGDGFLSQKRCVQWEEKITGEGSLQQTPQRRAGENFYLESPDGVRYTGKSDYPRGSDWYCVQSETVTPGSTIAESVSKSIGTDIDFIVNTDDLSGYVAAIADALINRLSKEAVSGLAGVFQPSEGSAPIGQTTTDCNDLEGAAQDACEEYQDRSGEATDRADEGINDLADRSDDATQRSRRSSVITYEKCEAWANDAIPSFGGLRDDAIKDCHQRTLAAGPYVEVGTAHILSANTSHTHTGAYSFSMAAPRQILLNYQWSWDQCPEGIGQCPELSLASGDLAAEDANIPGPEYTPTESGVYRLKLTVRDTGGDKTEMFLEEKTMVLSAGDIHDIEVGVEHTHDGAFVSDVSGELQSYDWELESCPGNCPDITKSGTFSTGNGGSIEGPTFTPQEPGDYTLRLNVRDVNGSVTSQTVTDVATGSANGGEGDQ